MDFLSLVNEVKIIKSRLGTPIQSYEASKYEPVLQTNSSQKYLSGLGIGKYKTGRGDWDKGYNIRITAL